MASPSVTPFWGNQTSNLNFCEEDYIVTRYIAEFINTLSSFVYILYGIYGLFDLRSKPNAGSRSLLYIGLMGVGVCSGLYHMTLKYHTQMMDELSMHLLTTPILFRVLTFKKSARYTKLVGAALVVEFTTVMVTHMVMDEFLLHATTFGAGAWTIAMRTLSIIRQEIKDPASRRNVRNVAIFGCCSFVFGYFVWLIDEWFCNALIGVRHSIGQPLAFLLELHGWWHLFTAIGGYIAVAVVDAITSGELQSDPTQRFAWPVPYAAKAMMGITGHEKQD